MTVAPAGENFPPLVDAPDDLNIPHEVCQPVLLGTGFSVPRAVDFVAAGGSALIAADRVEEEANAAWTAWRRGQERVVGPVYPISHLYGHSDSGSLYAHDVLARVRPLRDHTDEYLLVLSVESWTHFSGRFGICGDDKRFRERAMPGRRPFIGNIDSALPCENHGLMSLFITCPVQSVERATAFYSALGWTLNAEMSNDGVSCFELAPDQYIMLGSRQMYASVGGVDALIGGPETPSKVTVSFDLGSREAVDELVERAGAAGGRIGDTDDYPFMYQRQFDDPDGYHYSPFWMKPQLP